MESGSWDFFVRWPSIEPLHVIKRKVFKKLAGRTIHYRAKIKLHGTNAGVSIRSKGIRAQSRNKFLSAWEDNCDFHAWVSQNKNYFSSFIDSKNSSPTVIFGEWAGSGIHHGAIVNRIKERIFAVFAIYNEDDLIIEPEMISKFLAKSQVPIPSQIRVLPWQTEEMIFEFRNQQSVTKVVDEINELVKQIDKEDPWVKENFSRSGTGEGLVFYPTSLCGANGKLPMSQFGDYGFKTKGAHFTSNNLTEPAELEVPIARSPEQFADMFVTISRLQQGVVEACNGVFEKSKLKIFIEWITNDIRKETVLELEDSRMNWKDVEEPIVHKARRYYKMKIKDLDKKQKKSNSENSPIKETLDDEETLSLGFNKFSILNEVEE